MNQGAKFSPVDLTRFGISDAAKHLQHDGFLALSSHIGSLPDGLPPASSSEKHIAERYADPIRRAGFLARRRIARAVLSAAWDIPADAIEIAQGEAGEPLILAPSGLFYLSFAARDALALIGIATQPIGVDLEIARSDMLIPWNMLREDELDLLQKLPTSEHARAFCTLWTAKEAVVKTMGLGFRIPPEAIGIDGWVAGADLSVASLDARSAGAGLLAHQLHLKTCTNLVVAEWTGGLVVGAACIARS